MRVRALGDISELRAQRERNYYPQRRKINLDTFFLFVFLPP